MGSALNRTCSRIPSGNDWSCSSQPCERGFHGPGRSFLKKLVFERPSRVPSRRPEEVEPFAVEELFDSLPLSRPPNICRERRPDESSPDGDSYTEPARRILAGSDALEALLLIALELQRMPHVCPTPRSNTAFKDH